MSLGHVASSSNVHIKETVAKLISSINLLAIANAEL